MTFFYIKPSAWGRIYDLLKLLLMVIITQWFKLSLSYSLYYSYSNYHKVRLFWNYFFYSAKHLSQYRTCGTIRFGPIVIPASPNIWQFFAAVSCYITHQGFFFSTEYNSVSTSFIFFFTEIFHLQFVLLFNRIIIMLKHLVKMCLYWNFVFVPNCKSVFIT